MNLRKLINIGICVMMLAIVFPIETKADIVTDTWTNMNPAIHPAARNAHDMAYDAAGDRIILFGGTDASHRFDDTWAYDVNTNIWTDMNPTTHPSARYWYAMAYDNGSDRLVLFGGWRGFSDSETWAYDYNTNTWTNMNPAVHPSARTGSRMTYDVQSDRIILFGGQSYGGAIPSLGDTWAYDFNTNTWTNMNPATHPPETTGHALTYDVQSDRVILFGGVTNNGAVYSDETWAYDFNTNTWSNMNPAPRPSARAHTAMTYDSQSDRVVLSGGGHNNPPFDIRDDTWTYDYNTNTWTEMNPATHPSARYTSAMAYDGASDKVVLFGGLLNNYNDETWAYSMDSSNDIPEFPTIVIPVIAVIGLMFMFQRRKGK